MPSIISAGTTAGSAIALTGDTTGNLAFQTNGTTTAMTIDTSQRVGIGTSTTTDAGVTITTNVTRDGTWNAKLALQSTGSGNYPGLFFTGCSGSTRYSVIAQTASTSGDDFKQTTHQIMFVNNSSTSGDIRFDINGNVGTTNPTERMRINSNGNIALQGATLNASGVGITFPATQSASSDANCLDDYEEGTFTPTATGNTTAGTTTYVNRNGYYTKIGRQVTAVLYVQWSALTGTGDLLIGGLPFASAGLGQNYSAGSIVISDVNWTAGTMITPLAYDNQTYMKLFYQLDDGTTNAQLCVNEAAEMRITITYFTAT